MTKLRSYIIPILLALLLGFLQYRLWFETGGIFDMLRLKKEVSLQQQENDKLKKRNDTLLQQVQHIQKNKDAVESRARRELGMIKKGETFYQVVK
jgi:cell division protein FtsB